MIFNKTFVAMALAAVSATAVHAQPPAPAIETYRAAVASYVQTGDPAKAVEPLLGWSRQDLETAIKNVIAGGDAAAIEAAALLHLEIGVAVAGISTPSSAGFFELGAMLVDGLVPPNPDVRRELSVERIADIARVRATYLAAAGSAFASVSDMTRARSFFYRANRITPKSPRVLTLIGLADESDGAIQNPDDVESLMMKTRVQRERNRLLLSAEQKYREALEIDPDYPLALIRLGRVQFLLKNLKQAGELLQKGRATAKDPVHRYLAAMFTGALLQDQMDLAGAKAAFEEALEVAPRSQNAIVALAYVEMLTGRPDHAQALARGFTGTPDSDDSWWSHKNGTLDQEGLHWLRQRVRK